MLRFKSFFRSCLKKVHIVYQIIRSMNPISTVSIRSWPTFRIVKRFKIFIFFQYAWCAWLCFSSSNITGWEVRFCGLFLEINFFVVCCNLIMSRIRSWKFLSTVFFIPVWISYLYVEMHVQIIGWICFWTLKKYFHLVFMLIIEYKSKYLTFDINRSWHSHPV